MTFSSANQLDGGRHVGEHAVVLGAGMAGLLAARVLSDRFERVTAVERDPTPASLDPRPGVPQGRHAHAFLAGGQRALDELLPGITETLGDSGAPIGDMLGDTRTYVNGYRLRSAPTGVVVVSASRGFLEHHVRARVAAIGTIDYLNEVEVVGLATDGRHRVTGARVRHADGSEDVLDAELVVDALGRTSRAPRWFEDAGWPAPAEERIGIDLRYATRRFRARRNDLDGILACIHAPTPSLPRGAVLGRIEHDQWMLTLAGMTGERIPGDPDGFAAFARSLHSPDIDGILDRAEPIDDVALFRFPASVRRHYERLDRPPEGFVALGDSHCSLNPVYGQGMSLAAFQARALWEVGERSPAELMSRLSGEVDDTWAVVRASDLAMPGTDGRPNPMERVLGWYIRRLHRAASEDATLAEAFIRVAGLIDRSPTLLAPKVAARTLVPRLARRFPTIRHQ